MSKSFIDIHAVHVSTELPEAAAKQGASQPDPEEPGLTRRDCRGLDCSCLRRCLNEWAG